MKNEKFSLNEIISRQILLVISLEKRCLHKIFFKAQQFYTVW